jgi:hypothetical protein
MKINSWFLEKATVVADKWTIHFLRKQIVIGGKAFSFCEIPAPVGYAQSQSHPSILFFPNKWQGYSHVLATTPYPNADIRYENPCLYYASCKDSPTVFNPNPNNPVISPPPDIKAFNSDPCLFFEKNRLYLLNRKCERIPDLREIEVCYSDDGRNFSVPKTIITSKADEKELLSPSIIRHENKMKIYFLDGNAGISKNGRCKGLEIYEGSGFEHSDFTYFKKGQFLNSEELGIEPWHFDLFEFGKKLYMVFCGRNRHQKSLRNPMNTYLAVSEDYQNFRIFATPLVRLLKTYRPTAYMDEKGILHLYFSVVGKIAKDKSDRAIALTKFNFQELLKKYFQ